MRGAGLILGGSVTMCACAASSALGGSALIKAPIEQQCARQGLKGCPELVDGVMLYVDGDEPAAKRQLKLGASKNVPADLQRFALAISTVLPAKTGGFVTEILTGQITQDRPANDPSREVATNDEASQDSESPARFQPGFKTAGTLERVQLSMAAQTDPRRLTTESVAPLQAADKAPCQIGGGDAVCVKLEPGPLVITDAMTPPGCKMELIIGAANANGGLGWEAPTNSPGFHGARFFVRPNQWVVVAAKGTSLDNSGDARCYVTWAGFKPRIWLQDM